eukprot:TRINITY_DN23109_c0_g1_i2.p1 TRINITY_DN23109_c0_g1~~TRINITY_DN23109_c0_g1_i2.p1  ORF type:complete len:800 (+),score=172.51 TRINITY_DN23109_c0_g1_i2:139-2538(+)
MSVERIYAASEEAFTRQSVDYVEHEILSFQRRSPGNFILGLSGTNGQVRRARAADMFSELAGRDQIDWSRMRIFLVDERFGVKDEAESNSNLVSSSLLRVLHGLGLDFPASSFLHPDPGIEDWEAARADYEERLIAMFEREGRSGPNLVTLGLAEDLSIASIFPDWYKEEPSRWEQVKSQRLQCLCTETSQFECPRRICVNLRVLRNAEHVVLFVGKGKIESWEALFREVEDHKASRPHLSQASTMTFDAFSGGGGYPATPSELPGKMSSFDLEGKNLPQSPMLYVLKHNHVVIVKLHRDEKSHVSFVVVGAAGDLAKKKTFPSLFLLHLGRVLPTNTKIIGVDNPNFPNNKDLRGTDDLWNHRLKEYLNDLGHSSDHESFLHHLEYKGVDFADPASVKALNSYIRECCEDRPTDNRVFYLALPSFLFQGVVEAIRKDCWSETGYNRFIVEKPFGKNLKTALELASGILRHVDESQIYRIDHYLAKTMTMNILTLRFANRELGRLFHADNVANVRITFKEDISVKGRAGYFDGYGIIRDIMQNHLMQLLTLVAMEAPASLQAEDVRDEKVKVLKQIRPVLVEDCVVGQYDGYQDDPAIQEINEKKGYKSKCPTFATVVLYLDNERWSGVPFIMKAGKGLEQRSTIIRLQFKSAPPHSLFGTQPQNELVMRVQPDEAIYYKILAKTPGLSASASEVRRTVLDLDMKKSFQVSRLPEAYEKLIHDVIQGESHNFVRRDEVEEGWRIFDPLLKHLEGEDGPVPEPYEMGSRGPQASEQLIDRAGYRRYTKTGVPGTFGDDFS